MLRTWLIICPSWASIPPDFCAPATSRRSWSSDTRSSSSACSVVMGWCKKDEGGDLLGCRSWVVEEEGARVDKESACDLLLKKGAIDQGQRTLTPSTRSTSLANMLRTLPTGESTTARRLMGGTCVCLVYG